MKELMPCIRGTNLAMGLENRYHDDEIPFLDELWALLDPCQQNLSRGLEVLGKAGCVFRL
jgi:hypothetical protein